MHKRQRRSPRLAMTALSILALLLGSVAPGAIQAQEEPAPPSEETTILEEARELYEAVKETGEKVPSDIYEWIREDIGTIGDWEYRVVSFPGSDATKIEEKLNQLGQERWDCFWVQPDDSGARFFFKRPARNYLKSIPFGDLLKLLPSGSESD